MREPSAESCRVRSGVFPGYGTISAAQSVGSARSLKSAVSAASAAELKALEPIYLSRTKVSLYITSSFDVPPYSSLIVWCWVKFHQGRGVGGVLFQLLVFSGGKTCYFTIIMLYNAIIIVLRHVPECYSGMCKYNAIHVGFVYHAK
jgi:hypothetical protein